MVYDAGYHWEDARPHTPSVDPGYQRREDSRMGQQHLTEQVARQERSPVDNSMGKHTDPPVATLQELEELREEEDNQGEYDEGGIMSSPTPVRLGKRRTADLNDNTRSKKSKRTLT